MDKNLPSGVLFPVFPGTGVTSSDEKSMAARESFAGVMEDARVGVSLIFYVQNAVAYKKACVDQIF